MGRKGANKRKPKKSLPFTNKVAGATAQDNTPVQSLVKEKGAPLDREILTPPEGKHKKQKKH